MLDLITPYNFPLSEPKMRTSFKSSGSAVDCKILVPGTIEDYIRESRSANTLKAYLCFAADV